MLFSCFDYNKIICRPVAFPAQGGHCSAAGNIDPRILKLPTQAKLKLDHMVRVGWDENNKVLIKRFGQGASGIDSGKTLADRDTGCQNGLEVS